MKGFHFVCEAHFVDIRKACTGVRILAFVHDTHVLKGIVLIFFFLVLCLSICSCLRAGVHPDVEIGVKSFPVGVEVVVGDPSRKAILIESVSVSVSLSVSVSVSASVLVSVSDNKIQISILILRCLV